MPCPQHLPFQAEFILATEESIARFEEPQSTPMRIVYRELMIFRKKCYLKIIALISAK